MPALPKTRQGLRWLWHVVRYAVATVVAVGVAAIPPLLLAGLPFAGLALWCLGWAIGFVLYLLTGETAYVEIEEPIGIMVVPVLFTLAGVLAVIAALAVAIVFGFCFVLPVLLLSDILGRRVAPRSPGLRLGILLLAGALLGGVLAGALGLLALLGVLHLSPALLALLALALGLMALAAVFSGGLVLNALAWLGRKVANRRVTRPLVGRLV